MTCKGIKSQALDLMSKKWMKPFTIVCIVFAIFSAIFYIEMSLINYCLSYNSTINSQLGITDSLMKLIITGVGLLLVIFFASPCVCGAAWWYMQFIRGIDSEVGAIFVCYRDTRLYFKSVFINLLVILIFAVCSAPTTMCIIAFNKFLERAYSTTTNNFINFVLAVCFIILGICFAVLGLIIFFRFIAVDYIFAVNPDLSAIQIMKLSYSVMRNNILRMFYLFLSFIGWLIPALLIFPLLFIGPYFALSFTVLMNDIIETESAKDYNKSLRNLKKTALKSTAEA